MRILTVAKGFVRVEPHHLLSLILLVPLMVILILLVMGVGNSNLEPLQLCFMGLG